MNMFDILLAKKLAGGGSGPAPTLIEKNIDANGDYLASADNADGFSKVSVSVQPNLITKNITNNGTYQASSDSADGYSSVVVNVPGSHDISGDLTIESNEVKPSFYTINIPEGVTKIGASAFSQMQGLEYVVFPSTLVNIGDSAFNGCKTLKSVTVPSTITTFGVGVFSGCTSLESATVNTTSINANMFSACTALTSVTLPEGLTTITNQMFANCTSLEEVSIPSTVQILGTYSFQYSGLKHVTLGPNVKSIGNYCFAYSKLESIVIPDTVTNLSTSSVFRGCTSLMSADFCKLVTNINNNLVGCTSLRSLTFRREDAPVTVSLINMQDVPADCDIYVPADLVDSYKVNSAFSARADYIHAIPA